MAEAERQELRQMLGLQAPPPPGPLELTIRPSDVRPPVGVESAGVLGAALPAITPSAIPAPPLEVTRANESPKPSEGVTDFDVVLEALWQQESGNKQVDPKTGRTITSLAGALGVGQLMPGTAASLGVDPHDEAQNRAGSKRYLAEQFSKYGNYRDALGAYFAGPGAYDKWLDAGSPRDSKIGRQITQYQDTVLARAGILERGASAGRAPDGSTLGSAADLRAMLTDLPATTPEEEEARARLRRDREGGTFLEESTDRAKALAYSLYKGARNFELSVPQALMEQVWPEGAKGLTDAVNEADKPWEPLRQKHSYISGAGEIIGGTAALLASARLLGPPLAAGASAVGLTTVMRDIAPRVPWLLNAAGRLTTTGRLATAVPAGAAVTAGTTFTESGDPSARLWLAGLGAIAGPLGVAIGKGLSKAYQFAATRGELSRYMRELENNAKIIEPDLNYLKTVGVERIGKIEAEGGRRYALATATGQTVRGLDADTLSDAIRGYRTKAASEIEQTKNRLAQELGLDREAARASQAAVLRQQYDDQVRAVGKLQEEQIDRMLRSQGAAATNPTIRAATRRSLESDPTFPRVTVPPPDPYVPGTVSAEEFMKGRQLLAREMRQANTRAKREQLIGLRRELDKSFAEAARASGMSAGAFYRRLLEADKYYKANVVPAHDVFEDWFGKRFRGASRIADDSTNKLTQGVDPTKIFEKVVTTVETGTQREVDAMMHVFGTTPRDRERLVRSLAFRALTKAEGGINEAFDPTAVHKYINDNHKNLARVLTPEQYAWMKGFAKVSESLVNQMKATGRDARRFIWSSRVLNILGLERIVQGDTGGGVKLIASGIVAHTLMNNVPLLRALPMARLVARAEKLDPASPAFKELAKKLELQIAKSAVVSARAVGERAGIGDKRPQSFQPVAPMPAR